ncbi:MAG: hypothetical protein GY950_11530 [bacterium]|nr:hypothetical protein [bacterium]
MKLNKIILTIQLTLCIFVPFSSVTAAAPAPVLQSKSGDANAFDFWIGKWDLTWTVKEKIGKGKNKIKRILNDRVIKEKFEALSGTLKGFKGKSWSVYNPKTKKWKQTWVDNQGAYLDFTGEINGDKRIFKRQFKNNGKTMMQRMVFFNITKNNFDWNWESSVDSGKTWKLQWQIHYTRAPKKAKKKKEMEKKGKGTGKLNGE